MIDIRQAFGIEAARRNARAMARPVRVNEEADKAAAFAGRQVARLNVEANRALLSLPNRWRNKLAAEYERRRGGGALYAELAPAVEWLSEQAADYGVSRLALHAGDSEVIAEAERCAARCASIMGGLTGMPAGLAYMRAAEFAEAGGVVAPMAGPGALERLCCSMWWRRNLRRAHAKRVEGGAVRLGFVNRFADCYVSNESVARRDQQNKRNARTLERTAAVNEDGEIFSLAELASRSISNKAIKRGELMLRMRGFEEVAAECRHTGEFLTVTCPSRMHKFRTVRNGKGRVVRAEENPKYDGTRPDQAQAYLAGVWARCRAAFARQGIEVYGFRIAEPNHDGTPHWHMVLFMRREVREAFRQVIRRYALADSGSEEGAARYRCKFVRMWPHLGGAAAYIAKYVAKNIDGYGIEKDLFGNEAISASQRVEAWASTWRIRQFQQVGGAPIGVWRELRRVKVEAIEGAPAAVKAAHAAVNRSEDGERRADYAAFLRAMGGALRKPKEMLLSLARRVSEVVGRYGPATVDKPIGVACGAMVYASVRRVWRVLTTRSVVSWTRVNNCTAKPGPGTATEADLQDLRTRAPQIQQPKTAPGGVRNELSSA